MADPDPNATPTPTPIDITPAAERPIPQTIRRPETADVPPSTQYQGPSQADVDEAQRQVTEAQEALKQQQEDMQRWSQREQDFQNEYRAGMQKVQGELTEADKMRAQPPELLPMNERPEADLHAQNHLQWSWPNTLFTLGVLALGHAGKGHASALSNYFLGSFFSAYAAGQQERAKEMELGWHEQNENIYKENELRLNEYRAKLADSRLSLDSKIQVMKNLADQYKDAPMIKAIMTNNLTNIRAQLQSYDKSLKDLRDNMQKAHAAQQKLIKEQGDKVYEEAAAARFEQVHGHRPIDAAEMAAAHDEYRLYDHMKNKGVYGKDIMGRGLDAPGVKSTPTPKPGASASPTAVPTPTDEELERSIRLFENKRATSTQ